MPPTTGIATSARNISYTRTKPPAHYLFNIESFSTLRDSKADKYLSGVFESEQGFKWRLVLYPKGDTKNNGNGNISLYLAIDTEKFFRQHNWEVEVSYRLFVFDPNENKYLTVEEKDGEVRRFHGRKLQWGFSQLLSISDFESRYLVDDFCQFGAEVWIMTPTVKEETLRLIKNPPSGIFKFEFQNIRSNLNGFIKSNPFITVAGTNWLIRLYPRGESSQNVVSLFLEIDDWDKLADKKSVFAEFKIRIVNRFNRGNDKVKEGPFWFQSQAYGGFVDFMPTAEFLNSANGYVLDSGDDKAIVEVEILHISEVTTAEK